MAAFEATLDTRAPHTLRPSQAERRRTADSAARSPNRWAPSGIVAPDLAQRCRRGLRRTALRGSPPAMRWVFRTEAECTAVAFRNDVSRGVVLAIAL